MANAKLREKLDNIFSQYIRRVSADSDGYTQCCTCNMVFHWSELDAGHYVSRKHLNTRWDETNVYPQCIECNRYKHGNMDAFREFLGAQLVEELETKGRQISYVRDADIKVLIEEYRDKLNEL